MAAAGLLALSVVVGVAASSFGRNGFTRAIHLPLIDGLLVLALLRDIASAETSPDLTSRFAPVPGFVPARQTSVGDSQRMAWLLPSFRSSWSLFGPSEPRY